MAPCLLLIEPHDQGRIAQGSRLCQEFSNPVVVLSGFAGGREQPLQSHPPFPAQGWIGRDIVIHRTLVYGILTASSRWCTSVM
jgi:hypothetical protein